MFRRADQGGSNDGDVDAIGMEFLRHERARTRMVEKFALNNFIARIGVKIHCIGLPFLHSPFAEPRSSKARRGQNEYGSRGQYSWLTVLAVGSSKMRC